MLSFPGNLKVFIVLDACDMRAGVNTLHALVADKLKEDSRSGTLFVFTNKRRKLIKNALLGWHGHVAHDEAIGTRHVLLAARNGPAADQA